MKWRMREIKINFALIKISPEPELLVIFFCMSLKNPRVGIFFIFSRPPDLNFDSRILLQAGPHAVAGQGLHQQRHDHLVGDNEPCGVFGVISTKIYIFLRFYNIHVFWIIMPNLNYIQLFAIWHFYNVSKRPNTCMRNMYALSRLTCEQKMNDQLPMISCKESL